jgi:Putative DNA-binding domain
MSEQIPLGQSEGERREFKGKDVLRHLPNVSREVVGMLNATGGEIWIGLAEEQGRAARVEAIDNATRELTRLRDHFTDAIEPSPTSSEIVVERVPFEDKGDLLKVRVKPVPRRAPYALREGTARHFIKRFHDRLRPMSREEIFNTTAQPDHPHDAALGKIRTARERHRNKQTFWLRIQPVGDVDLRLGRDFREYFTNPVKTENRTAGWNFVDSDTIFEARPNEIRHGRAGETYIQVFRDGAIEFTMPIINLYWKSTGGLGNTEVNEVWPYALLEFPASVFRLAATIYRERECHMDTVIADLALFGIKGWTLRPHSPVSFGYKLARPRRFEEAEIVSAEPLSFSMEEVINQPDRCAFRLVRRVYEAFEYFEDEMPMEFNKESGRLILQGA